MSTRPALQNIIDNLKNGSFRIILVDEGKESDVTAENIRNLEEALRTTDKYNNPPSRVECPACAGHFKTNPPEHAYA